MRAQEMHWQGQCAGNGPGKGVVAFAMFRSRIRHFACLCQGLRGILQEGLTGWGKVTIKG